MTLYLPSDIAQYIQSYIDNVNFITSLSVCKSFTPNFCDRVFYYTNPNYKLPTWVTRVELGGQIRDENLKNCKQLVELHIGHAKIETITVKKLENMKVLKLGWSKISYKALIKMNQLEHLDIQYATKCFGQSFPCLKSLKYLDLGGRKCNYNAYSFWLTYLINLEWLNLGMQKILVFDLKNMTKLRYLDAKHSDFEMKHLIHLPLETLHMDCSVSEKGPIEIPTLKFLHQYTMFVVGRSVDGHENMVTTMNGIKC